MPELTLLLQQGIRLREAGEYSEAIALLTNQLDQFSAQVEFLSLLSHCYILNEDMESASKFLKRAKSSDPQNASVGWNEARLNLKNKNFADALAIAIKTNQLFPEDAEGLGVVGACLRASGKNEESLVYLNKAIS